jgi:hypothetical protein
MVPATVEGGTLGGTPQAQRRHPAFLHTFDAQAAQQRDTFRRRRRAEIVSRRNVRIAAGGAPGGQE